MKKKNIFLIIVLIVGLFTMSGCSNSGATQWGGTKTINIPDGMKFVHYNIQKDDIWCTYRPMRDDEIPETYIIKQTKDIGLMGNGTIIIYESKDGKKSEDISETKDTVNTVQNNN